MQLQECRVRVERDGKGCGSCALFSGPELETQIPLPPALGTGDVRVMRLEPGLGVVLARFRTGSEDCTVRVVSGNRVIRLAYVLSPTEAAVPQGHAIFSYVPREAVRLVPGNTLVHTVFIVATPAYLESLVTDCDPQIRALLESVRRNPDDTVIATERVTRTLRIALEQLQHCSAAGRLGQLYAEGKVFEILALHFEQLASGGQGCADEVRMSNSEVARIREARSVLLGRMQDPPSLTELARDVAISLKKLKVGFRHVYGETPFECLRHERLRLAKELLEEGDKQVSEVAFHVGYNSLSHFAVAFRQEFGACPHWYRHQAMTSARRGRRESDE